MGSYAVSTIIANARLRFNDLTDADGLTYLKEGRAEVLSLLDLRKATISITTLVSGTAEYTLSAVAYSVDQVRYVRTSADNDHKVLYATNKPELYARRTDWLRRDDGEPQEFYLWQGTSGPVIGLIPAPDTSSSGGYPKLDIDVSQDETITGASTLTDDLPSASVYINYIKKRMAEDHYPEAVAQFTKLYEHDLKKAQNYLYRKNRQAPPSMSPAIMNRRMSVR